jgi:hypothetical protein
MRLTVLLFLLVVGIDAVAGPKEAPLIVRAKTAVTDELKDPESARFRGVQIVRGSVCGEVNAKNSMGGYVGFKRFVAIAGVVVTFDDERSPFQSMWEAACLRNPPKPPEPTPYHEKWLDDPKQ